LGVFDDFNFEQQEVTLEPGTTVFLYTDGLTEAKDLRHKLFGIDRVTEHLSPALTCQQLLEGMTEAVHRFVQGAEQSDDLTMLSIRYTP
jgi:sigma-B regulation protein RsbU (phosphoserine phosphatase)